MEHAKGKEMDLHKTPSLPPVKTRLTNPTSKASLALNSLPVRATSRVKDSLPTILGNRASEPTSAAMPISTS